MMTTPQLALLTALTLTLPCSAAELRVPGADLARVLEEALTGTQVHLDHDLGKGAKAAPRSFVALPPGLGSKRLEFSVAEQVFDLGSAGEVEYRVNDVNLLRSQVAATARDYVLTLYFEDEGKEVLSRHRGGMFDLGGAVPDLQMNAMKMEVVLTTSSAKDRPSFSSAKVRFDADIRPDGDGASLLAGALESSGYQEQIKRAIEREAQKSIGGPGVLEALSAKLWDALNERAGGKAAKARFDGTDLVIELPEEPQKPAPKAPPKKRR
ncbi:MAG: hypothetical protein ACYC8T_00625 [Myxococcaceae bacterium]